MGREWPSDRAPRTPLPGTSNLGSPVPFHAVLRRPRVLVVTAACSAVLVVPGAALAGGDPSAPDHEAVEHPDTVPAHDIGGLDLDAATIPDLQAGMDAGQLTSVDLTSA